MRAIGSLRLLACAAGLLTAGCGLVQESFKEPEYKVSKAVLRGIGLTGGTIDLVVEVTNPNPISIQGTNLTVGVNVDSTHVGDIQYNQNFELPANGSTTLTLPLKFGWGGAGKLLKSAISRGEFPYQLKGEATLNTPLGSKVFPWTREGSVPLTKSTTDKAAV